MPLTSPLMAQMQASLMTAVQVVKHRIKMRFRLMLVEQMTI